MQREYVLLLAGQAVGLLMRMTPADLEEAAKAEGLHPDHRDNLPTLAPVSLHPRKQFWARKDIAVLAYLLHCRCLTEEGKRPKPLPPLVKNRSKKPPKPLPPRSELPPQLLPVADELKTEWDGTAIYFLFRKKVVVYVGSSAANPIRRISQHRHGSRTTEPKDFDAYLFYPVPLDNMLQAERNFVALLDPEYNRNLKLASQPYPRLPTDIPKLALPPEVEGSPILTESEVAKR